MVKKLKLDFDGWPDLVAALSRKPYARLRSKAERMRKAKRRMKTLNKRLDANRKMNRAIELEVNGLAARGRALATAPLAVASRHLSRRARANAKRNKPVVRAGSADHAPSASNLSQARPSRNEAKP